MRVTHRLYLAAFPSVVGVVAVAALAYWGQFARAVPELFVVVAAVAAISSMALSWTNVRYVAARVERMAARPMTTHGDLHFMDELDAIEGTVAELNTAVRAEQTGRKDDQALLQSRRTQDAQVLAAVATSAIHGMNEVRLPLHILLENHFGDLNENQEEMLESARRAAEVIDRDFEALQELARFELGELTLRRDRIFPSDLVHAILPSLNSVAESHHVVLHTDIAALIAPIASDASRLQEALLTLVSPYLLALSAETAVAFTLAVEDARAVVTLNPAEPLQQNVRVLLARRVILLAGGFIEESNGMLRIGLPR